MESIVVHEYSSFDRCTHEWLPLCSLCGFSIRVQDIVSSRHLLGTGPETLHTSLPSSTVVWMFDDKVTCRSPMHRTCIVTLLQYSTIM